LLLQRLFEGGELAGLLLNLLFFPSASPLYVSHFYFGTMSEERLETFQAGCKLVSFVCKTAFDSPLSCEAHLPSAAGSAYSQFFEAP